MSAYGRTVTPEAVTIALDAAGLGSRMIAWLIDTLIQLAIAVPIVLGIGAGDLSGSVELVVLSLILFLLFWGYYPIFELSWQGQTPGKRAQRLRVIRTDGQPAGGAAIMVRNLIRILEVFMLPFLAVISMIVTARAQRLGDLAAGTLVIREARFSAPQSVVSASRPDLPERDYDMIRSFLARRKSLDPTARWRLAAQLATAIRGRVGSLPDGLADETMLEAIAQSYRQRFENGNPAR